MRMRGDARRAWLAAFVAGILLMAMSIAPATAHGGQGEGRIVFSSSIGDGSYYNLYSMRPDGTDVIRLTNGEWDDTSAAWSPDGRKIAFVSYRDDGVQTELYVMNADGSHVKRLTKTPEFELGPSWSLDGRSIVFGTQHDDTRDLFVMRADGTHVTKVPGLTGVNDWASFIGQDKLLVHHRIDDTTDNYLFTVRTDGSGFRQLTPGSLQAGPATWTANGNLITFENNYATGDFSHLFVMRADGTHVRQIENVDGNHNLFPHWSPDGRKITFQSFSLTHPVFTDFNIHTIKLDGSREVDLTNNEFSNIQPAWGCPDRTCR